MFSCEFCEISKNTFFTEHLRATAFVIYFAFIFKEHITITFSKEALKVFEQNYFQEYKQKTQ